MGVFMRASEATFKGDPVVCELVMVGASVVVMRVIRMVVGDLRGGDQQGGPSA